MSKKLIILLLLLVYALIIIYITKTPKKSNTVYSPISPPISPIITEPTKSALLFIPETIYAISGQNIKVNIQINSQGKSPTSAQIELAYDPEILTKVAITPGTFFPNSKILLNNNDEKRGRISYALTHNTSENPPHTSGTIAVLNFTINKNSFQKETTLNFLPKTTIISQNDIIPSTTSGLTIFINPTMK